MLTLLDRTVLREAAWLTALYSIAFLGLISVAVAVPLVRGGAPLWDVIVFLPNQLAFPATLALPLALITATLSTLGRMREDGELIALMAAGVSTLRLVRAIAPLALVVAAAVAWLSFVSMPTAYRNFTTGRNALLRQAMATKVARQEPIYQKNDFYGLDQLALAARDARGDELTDLFAWRLDREGRLVVAYAPKARWISAEVEEGLADKRPNLAAKAPPGVDLPPGLLPDGADTATGADRRAVALTLHLADLRILHRTIGFDFLDEDQKQALDALAEQRRSLLGNLDLEHLDPEQLALLQTMVEDEGDVRSNFDNPEAPFPLMLGNVPRWSVRLISDKASAHLPPEGKDLEQIVSYIETATTNLAAAKTVLATWRENLSYGLGPNGQEIDFVQAATFAAALPQADKHLDNARRDIANHRFAWHLRHMLPAAAVCWWLFGCGLALALPSRNRLLAVFVGLLTVIGTVLPAIALIKGSGGLGVDPGTLLWSPPAALAALGAVLAWWWRG